MTRSALSFSRHARTDRLSWDKRFKLGIAELENVPVVTLASQAGQLHDQTAVIELLPSPPAGKEGAKGRGWRRGRGGRRGRKNSAA